MIASTPSGPLLTLRSHTFPHAPFFPTSLSYPHFSPLIFLFVPQPWAKGHSCCVFVIYHQAVSRRQCPANLSIVLRSDFHSSCSRMFPGPWRVRHGCIPGDLVLSSHPFSALRLVMGPHVVPTTLWLQRLPYIQQNDKYYTTVSCLRV